MAVTYAWRLDTNKYAYLVPPVPFEDIVENDEDSGFSDEEWEAYGFLSNTPLTDYFMRNVGTIAENTFGQTEDGDSNLSLYERAFEVMLVKIKKASENGYWQRLNGDDDDELFDWRGMSGVDLLSADVYYNIDAKECADLRGVGIKSIQFLGSIEDSTFVEEGRFDEGYLLSDMKYKVKNSETTVSYINDKKEIETKNIIVQPGIPGFTDVYGIYLEDQIDENGKSTSTPEHIFIVRNGKHGLQGAKGDKGTDAIYTPDGEMIADLEELKQTVETLEENTSIFTQFINEISNGGTNASGLSDRLKQIEDKLDALTAELDIIKQRLDEGDVGGEDGPPDGGDGSVTVFKLWQTEGSTANTLTNDWNPIDNEINYGPEEYDNEYIFKSESGNQLYLLGFLDTKDTETTKGSAKVQTLFAIPNIAIDSTGITIKGGIKANEITADNIYAESEMYSQKGFYEEVYEDRYKGVDSVTIYDEENGEE